jgi:hypothetical protein
VDYKGKRVLFKAHAPIWNVLYENRIQEYRDWTTEESGFDAIGTNLKDVHGTDLKHFINCTRAPQTVFETGRDGTFTGVAFFKNPDQSWTLSTMMVAGWYRYYMAYTFFPDGSIKPRVGFTTNGSNPYAGKLHFHNCYFRFDFDIEGAANDAISTDGFRTLWDPAIQNFRTTHEIRRLVFETKLNRPSGTNYLVEDKVTKRGYRLIPGSADGTAATDTYNFSKGDIWALLSRNNEIDDGVPMLSQPADAKLDNFVNGDSIDGANVVLWYAVHFAHDPSHTSGEKDFGPDLHPLGVWG